MHGSANPAGFGRAGCEDDWVTAQVLSTRVLNRTLLARQHLLERTTMPALAMVEHLVGMQAQEPKDPYVALWSRLRDFDPAELERLLLDKRAVRMALMRSTIHLVSTEDALAFRPVVQPVLDGELFRNKTWSVGLEGVDLDPVLALGRQLVEERPRSLAELRVAMAERFPDRDAPNLAYACRGLLPTFQVTPRGLWHTTGQVRLTTLDTWSGRPLGAETAPDAMILRYLAAFGPAATSDVAAWTRLTGLKEPMERLRPRLRTFRDERGRELFDVPGAPIAEADVPAPVRFFPFYDNVYLSHADRARIIPEEARTSERSLVGGAAFSVDGFMAGFWTTKGKGHERTITLEPMTPLSGAQRRETEAEALLLRRFLDAGGDAGPDPVRWST
ncbi:MAG TPA: winged helix DNA-binding domain-containing protein [Candidatus Limnocylindrales bacterium]